MMRMHGYGWLVLVVATLAASCHTVVVCKAGLVNVEVENVPRGERESRTTGVCEAPAEGISCYEDECISMVWTDAGSRLNFELKNRTEADMVLHWDSVRYVDYNGSSSPVIHHGIRYCDKGELMGDAVVRSGESLLDMVLPAQNVYYNKLAKGNGQKKWLEVSLFPERYGNGSDGHAGLESGRELKRTMSVFMPFTIKGARRNYIFGFAASPEDAERLERAVRDKRP